LRILIVTAAVLIALIAAGLVAASRLVAWDDYRDQLTAQAEALTGRSVAIRGRIDLDLLPRPTLTLGQTTLASPPDADDGVRLEVDRLDLELKPLPLLGGRLDVDEVRLVRPVWQVAPVAEQGSKPLRLGAVAAWLPPTPGGPSRVSIVDGRVVLPPSTLGEVSRLEQINLVLAATPPSGALVLDGTFALNSQSFRIDARIGRLTDERSSTVRMELSVGDAGASTLTFGGVVWWRADAPRLRGELTVAGADARSAIGAASTAVGQEIVPMPPWLAAPFRLTGRLGLEDQRLELSAGALALDGAELNGSLRVLLAAVPEIHLQIRTPQLDIPPGPPAGVTDGGLAPLLAFASSIHGEVDLAVGALDYGGIAAQQVRASVRLGGDGAAMISDARAVLPGQTDVSFAGRLTGVAADAELRGKLTAVTQDLRGALAAFDLRPGEVAESRLNSLSLASEVSLRRDAWRFGRIELRVDATRGTGSLAINPGPRPRIAADLALDRFDADAYWPDQTAGDLLARLAGPLGTVDAAIEAQLARLTWRGVYLQDVGLAARAVNGRVRIKELTVGNLAEAKGRVVGDLDLAARAFDLSAELRDVQPARLLRRLGYDPWLPLARLKPATIEGRATGSFDVAQVELEAGDGAATVELAGEVGWTGEQPHYQLDVDAEHPDFRALLADLGAGTFFAPGPTGPLSLAGRVQRDPEGAAAVAGTARLGVTSFTGRVAWQADQARPRFAARISVGEPSAPVLGGLLDLSGLHLEWPAPDGGFQGRWSGRLLALPLLDRFDGELMLSSKGGLAGDGLELTARLEQGRLTFDQVALALWRGRLHGQLSFDARRPLPYMVAELDLDAFDPSGLAAWFGVPPLVAGPADLHVAATGAGDSVRALVRSLLGQVEFRAQGGVLPQALPEDLAASSPEQHGGGAGAAAPASLAVSFALERGILVTRPTELEFGDLRARLEGSVDLYLWAVDLTLQAADGGPVLKVVGPLHRPQVRLLGVSAPAQRSPGPPGAP
jgi:uncharacterized protein involved in outer membrane biogenesis